MRQNAAFASRALRSFSACAIRRSGGRRPSGGSDRRSDVRRPAEPGRLEKGWFASGARDGAFGHPRPAPGRSAARTGGRRSAPATHADKSRTLRISGQYVAKMQLLAAPVAAAAGSRRRRPLPARGGAVARPGAPLRRADARYGQGRGRFAPQARDGPAPAMQGRTPPGPHWQGDSRTPRRLDRVRRGTGFAPGARCAEASCGALRRRAAATPRPSVPGIARRCRTGAIFLVDSAPLLLEKPSRQHIAEQGRPNEQQRV